MIKHRTVRPIRYPFKESFLYITFTSDHRPKPMKHFVVRT